MAKPKTTYTPVTKNKTTFSKVAKSVVSFNPISKNKTTLAKVAKNPTTFNRSGSSLSSVLLNSTVVTLNSLTVLLSGYTGSTPNQNSNKNATTFTAV